MAVSVDTVYQRVLALANKEQRGYITPQEFNLLANQAQMEIIDQYFYDINQFGRMHGNDTEYSDMLNLIDEKLSVLKTVNLFTAVGGFISRGALSNIYKIGTVIDSTNNVEIEEVNENELLYINLSPLAQPTESRPVYTSREDGLHIVPSTVSAVNISYVKLPSNVSWGYVVDGLGNALYNSPVSSNFEIHKSEEVELVYKILKLAGVTIQRQEILSAGQGIEAGQVQQEKQ